MYQTQNYTIIWCEKCQDRTIIEPGKPFESLNCKCATVKPKEEDGTVKHRTARKAKE